MARAPGADSSARGLSVVVDCILKFCPRAAEPAARERWSGCRIDHRGFEGAHPGDLEVIHELPRGEEGALAVSGVEEIHGYLSRGKGHAVELEIPGFLHRAAAHGDLIEQGFLDVRLPNAYLAGALRGDPGLIDEAFFNGEGPTAAERLPQFPDQSTKGESMEIWPKR